MRVRPKGTPRPIPRAMICSLEWMDEVEVVPVEVERLLEEVPVAVGFGRDEDPDVDVVSGICMALSLMLPRLNFLFCVQQ